MKQISDTSFSHDPIFEQANFRQTELENKLNSYFENRRSSKQQSQTASNRPSNHTMDFKIMFTKPEPQPNNHQIPNESLNSQNRNNLNNKKQPSVKRKVHSEYTLNKKEVKESLSKKKLNLMEFKLKQLEQEVELELQSKIDLFKQNQQLEKEIKRIDEQMKGNKIKIKTEADDFNYQILELQTNLRREKERNKSIKKQVERLKQRKRSTQQLRVNHSSATHNYQSKNNSEVQRLKAQLQEERKNYRKLKQKFQDNQQLHMLSSQLKRLRKMVEKQAKGKRI